MENNLTTMEGPQSLLALAIEKGADMAQLEKLMELKERWDAQQANKSFLLAMSLFQKDVPEIKKKKLVNYPSKTGGHVNYKYAELGEIDETIKEAMATNGLSKRWEISEEGEKLICTCIISHLDGHTERTTMSSIKDASGGKNEIQSRASAISYLQRYTLIGSLGLTTASEDNDCDGTAPPTNQKNDYPTDNREWLTEKQLKEALTKIHNGESGIWQKLAQEFKMKKDYKDQLLNANPLAKKDSIAEDTEKDKPFEIPGNWFAKMEKCKSKADVLKVYQDNKETVDAHPELQALLKETQNSFNKNLKPA